MYIHTLLLRLVMTSTRSCRTACSMCVCLRVLIEFPRLFSFIIHSRCHRASLTVKNCEKYSLQKNYLYNRCISIRVCTITSMYLVVYPILLFVFSFFFLKFDNLARQMIRFRWKLADSKLDLDTFEEKWRIRLKERNKIYTRLYTNKWNVLNK